MISLSDFSCRRDNKYPRNVAGAGRFRNITEIELLLITPATGSQQNLQRTIRGQPKKLKYFIDGSELNIHSSQQFENHSVWRPISVSFRRTAAVASFLHTFDGIRQRSVSHKIPLQC